MDIHEHRLKVPEVCVKDLGTLNIFLLYFYSFCVSYYVKVLELCLNNEKASENLV